MSKSVRSYDRSGHRTGTTISHGVSSKHYDSKGNRTGTSITRGNYVKHYDNKGKFTGSSIKRGSSYSHYDKNGHRTGSSINRGFGYSHYDNKGHYTGSSGGGSSSEGCYIATCVYGSYDSPEVMALRRYRDEVLKKSMPGRGFIRFYYKVSPWLVRHFGQKKWIRSFWKRQLDCMIRRLGR